MNQVALIVLWILFIIIIIGIIIWILFCGLKEKYLRSDPMLEKLRSEISKVSPQINSVALYKGNKSYTLNKEKIFICLKDENNKYYNFNMLIISDTHILL